MANTKPKQPDVREQSGSTGRATPDHAKSHDEDTGQGRYGQTGFGGHEPPKTQGREQYQRSERDGDPASKQESNPGSGRPEDDETKKKNRTVKDGRDVPKTG
jgi:hypothetical protein